ncbi:unnamed protein product [Albugo candida]|uniref:Protein kinase domain-containing protein n=1 Tax=Albugo candida TaxID=65357 RepID=A0A024GRF1_9STRA|nr:unnamed protein product [Albugo candida]|eukprot:CCI49364.1 unnamed protein product [Albugo candida]
MEKYSCPFLKICRIHLHMPRPIHWCNFCHRLFAECLFNIISARFDIFRASHSMYCIIDQHLSGFSASTDLSYYQLDFRHSTKKCQGTMEVSHFTQITFRKNSTTTLTILNQFHKETKRRFGADSCFNLCRSNALVGLHALRYVHRDIRWLNILSLGDDSYILVDFENAGRDGDRMPDELLESRVLDPLVKSGGYDNVYRSYHDMYQFGRLIVDTSDPSLAQILMNLQSDNVEERYTAEGALNFLLSLHKRVQDDLLNAMEL